MTLEDQIAYDMANALRNEIDFQVLAGMLVELGWTQVVLRPMTHEHGVHVDHWVKTHCKSGVETLGLVWLFEDSKEANWFTLKWL